MWGYVAAAALTYLQAKGASDASSSSAESQTDAERQRLNLDREMYEQGRADLAPFRANELQASNISTGALNELSQRIGRGPGEFKQSDDYRFALDQGINALDKSAVAGGRTRNADTMRFATGLASQERGNFLNRYNQSLAPLQSIARVPQGSTAQSVGLGQNYAGQAGNAFSRIGQANAANAINQSNIRTDATQNLINNSMQYYYGRQ